MGLIYSLHTLHLSVLYIKKILCLFVFNVFSLIEGKKVLHSALQHLSILNMTKIYLFPVALILSHTHTILRTLCLIERTVAIL
jgi:hypothetical protein